jgi:hypothetical protein
MTSFNSHNCNFLPVGEPEFLEQRVIVVMECNFVEVTSRRHSEKHDETFYGTGRECENQRVIELEQAEVTPLDGPTHPDDFYAEADTMAENADINHYDKGAEIALQSIVATDDPCIVRENDDYRIRYER